MFAHMHYIYDRYFLGWFWIDLITSLPIEFMFDNSTSDNIGSIIKAVRVVRIFRMIKILRFFRMLRIIDGILQYLFSRWLTMFVRLCRILFVMTLFAHFGACTWYAVGNYGSKHYSTSWLEAQEVTSDDSNWTKYSLSWYWSIVTLMTTGYGDITATNILEQWVSSIFILIGTCFFAYFIGAVSSLLAEGDRVRAERLEKIEQAQQFCGAKKIPKELAHAILTHTKYYCKHNFLFDEMTVLDNLPSYLRYEKIVYFLCFVEYMV